MRGRGTSAAFSVLLLIAASGPVAFAAERVWTRSDILAIADAEAKRLGYDVDHMGVAFDIYNSRWNELVGSTPPETASIGLLKKLDGRRYFAVYYSLMKEPMKGGDLFVFIDRATSEVVGTLQGQ